MTMRSKGCDGTCETKGYMRKMIIGAYLEHVRCIPEAEKRLLRSTW